MLRSIKVALIRPLPLLLLLITASGCAGPGSLQSAFPPRADLEAVTEAKPMPTAAIATSAQVAEQYNADVEGWGDRVSAAGARLCRFYRDLGMKVKCPDPK